MKINSIPSLIVVAHVKRLPVLFRKSCASIWPRWNKVDTSWIYCNWPTYHFAFEVWHTSCVWRCITCLWSTTVTDPDPSQLNNCELDGSTTRIIIILVLRSLGKRVVESSRHRGKLKEKDGTMHSWCCKCSSKPYFRHKNNFTWMLRQEVTWMEWWRPIAIE